MPNTSAAAMPKQAARKGFHDSLAENNASLVKTAKVQKQGPVGPEVLAALIANKQYNDSQKQAAYHAEKAWARNSGKDMDAVKERISNSSSSTKKTAGTSTQNDYLNFSNKRGPGAKKK